MVVEALGATPVNGSSSKWSCRCPNKAGHKNGDRTPSACLFISGKTGDLMFSCRACGIKGKDVAKIIDIPIHYWCKKSAVAQRVLKPVKYEEFVYRDLSGRVQYRVLRSSAGSKSFTQQRAVYDELGVSILGWTNSLADGVYIQDLYGSRKFRSMSDGESIECPQTGQDRTVVSLVGFGPLPYKLDYWGNLAKSQDPLFVVEGEKKVHAVEKCGFYATCNNGGAGNWVQSQGMHLRGKRVIILPDNDDPGMKHALIVAGSAVYNGAASVYIYPYLYDRADLHNDHKSDICDVIDKVGIGQTTIFLKDIVKYSETLSHYGYGVPRHEPAKRH